MGSTISTILLALGKQGVVMATEEEGRKKLAIIIGVPIFAIMFIVCLYAYLLSTPLELLKIVLDDDDFNVVLDLRNEKVYTEDYIGNEIDESFVEWIGEFPYPVINKRITSRYGKRIHPITKRKSFHHGLDMVGDERIMTIADGIVTDIYINTYTGGTIKIKHSDGWESLYAHIRKFHVKVGESVSVGQVIGTMGGGKFDDYKGYSTGRHLHLELYKDGKEVDPEYFLQNAVNANENEGE